MVPRIDTGRGRAPPLAVFLLFGLATILAACMATPADGDAAGTNPKRAPLAMADLRELAVDSPLSVVRDLDRGPGYSAYLVSYRHAELELFAMVAVPTSARPEHGYPAVVANHGYVPDPRRYGFGADGRDSRPGDYYRSVPGLFASRGFVVVLPDYRGHNSSEGLEYVDPQDDHSVAYYTEDVVALLARIGDIEVIDEDNVFMWSHSMGGSVSLAAMIAAGGIRASSFWATMAVDRWLPQLGELEGPVLLHHSVDDQSADYTNSVRFARALQSRDLLQEFHRYDGDAHLFAEPDLQIAADRDAAFFRRMMRVR